MDLASTGSVITKHKIDTIYKKKELESYLRKDEKKESKEDIPNEEREDKKIKDVESI